MAIETIEQASAQIIEVEGNGSGRRPPTTALGANPEENDQAPSVIVTPLVYESPNPNSRAGVHPPRNVFDSGFSSYGSTHGSYCLLTEKLTVQET